MSEGKRIEGQMFLKGGIGWTVGLLVLLIAAGGTLLIGYVVNRWVGFVSATSLQAVGGTGVPAGLPAGTVWAGGLATMPGMGNAQAAPGAVQWPVPAGGTFREHWEQQQPGIGTLYEWYMDPGSPQYWQLSKAISIPVKGENVYVIAVHIPRDAEPATATEGQIWVCELQQSPTGDVAPSAMSVRIRAGLDAEKLKYLWENDFPPGLIQDLIDGANSKGPFATATPGQTSPLVLIDEYFKKLPPAAGKEAAEPTEPANQPE